MSAADGGTRILMACASMFGLGIGAVSIARSSARRTSFVVARCERLVLLRPLLDGVPVAQTAAWFLRERERDQRFDSTGAPAARPPAPPRVSLRRNDRPSRAPGMARPTDTSHSRARCRAASDDDDTADTVRSLTLAVSQKCTDTVAALARTASGTCADTTDAVALLVRTKSQACAETLQGGAAELAQRHRHLSRSLRRVLQRVHPLQLNEDRQVCQTTGPRGFSALSARLSFSVGQLPHPRTCARRPYFPSKQRAREAQSTRTQRQVQEAQRRLLPLSPEPRRGCMRGCTRCGFSTSAASC